MSWQDDLRRLDADLAAGRIEPAAHRKQRDELLAQASGSTVPSPVPSPLRRPATAWHSTNPAAQQPVDPRSAPPQRTESPSPGRPPRPVPPWQRTESGPQKTISQPVVPPVPDYLTTAPSPADINPTRYMTVEGHVPDGEPISRFPPLGGPVHHWPQEPEEAPGKHRFAERRRPTVLFVGLGVLVVLAMIAGVTAWVASRDDSPPPAAQSPATQQSGAPSSAVGVRPTPLEETLPKLPGEANPNNSTLTIAKARDLGLIPATTADLFTSNGAKEMVFRGSSDGDVNYLVLVIPTGGTANAQTVVETLYQQALASGMRPVDAEVRTISGHLGQQFFNTSWYGSGNNAVLVGVGLPYRGQSGMSGQLDGMLKQFESVLPAG